MAISEPDIKMLWGRAAGICFNPHSDRELTALLPGCEGYNIGEMALLQKAFSCELNVGKAASDAIRSEEEIA